MPMLRTLLAHLRKEQAKLKKQARALDDTIAALGRLGHSAQVSVVKKARKISKAGRERIAAAQRARWAKVRKALRGKKR